MTPLGIVEIGIILSFYLMKWLRYRQDKLELELDDLPLCSERYRADNNISSFPGLGEYTGVRDQETIFINYKFTQSAYPNTMVVLPGKVWHFDIEVDPAVKIYDEEYWRKWKRDHKHEEDGG